jgi:signal transduction histidine kinase
VNAPDSTYSAHLDPLRLQAVHASGLLDSPREHDFDQLIRLTVRLLKVPMAMVSLVDERRQFFKAQCGVPEPYGTQRETPISHSICRHVAGSGEVLIIEDARAHPLVRESLAVRELNMIAYAGIPLRDTGGYVLGSFCAIDTKPRRWTNEDVETLHALADQATIEISLRAISEERMLENAALKQSVESTEQMIRLDQHDLRAPLNAMMLNLQAIELFGDLNKDQREFAEKARRNGTALTAMIDRMLDVKNIEHRGAAAMNFHDALPLELVAEALEQVAPQAAEKGIRVIGPARGAVAGIQVDGDKLARVLMNLLANAIKFTPAGGEVRLEADDIEENGRRALRFIVSDTGIGIAPEHLDAIFAEGFRVDSAAATNRSTGLGLTFCKRVVEAHGGRIGVESQPGAGSTFTVLIPDN